MIFEQHPTLPAPPGGWLSVPGRRYAGITEPPKQKTIRVPKTEPEKQVQIGKRGLIGQTSPIVISFGECVCKDCARYRQTKANNVIVNTRDRKKYERHRRIALHPAVERAKIYKHVQRYRQTENGRRVWAANILEWIEKDDVRLEAVRGTVLESLYNNLRVRAIKTDEGELSIFERISESDISKDSNLRSKRNTKRKRIQKLH